jgi:hypothetical protein
MLNFQKVLNLRTISDLLNNVYKLFCKMNQKYFLDFSQKYIFEEPNEMEKIIRRKYLWYTIESCASKNQRDLSNNKNIHTTLTEQIPKLSGNL